MRQSNCGRSRLCPAILAACLAFGLRLGSAGVSPVSAAELSAAEKQAVKSLMQQGDEFATARDYPRALERYLAAYRLVHVPSVGMEVVKARVELGQWVEAWADAIEVNHLPRLPGEPPAFERARIEAGKLAESMEARVPTLAIEVLPEGLDYQVVIDGAVGERATAAAPVRLNPGPHRVAVNAAGHSRFERALALKEGAREKLSVNLAAEAPAAQEQLASAQPGAATLVAVQSAATQPVASLPPDATLPDAAVSAQLRTDPYGGSADGTASAAEAASERASRTSSAQVAFGIAGAAGVVGLGAAFVASFHDGDSSSTSPAAYVAGSALGGALLFAIIGAAALPRSDPAPATSPQATRSSLSFSVVSNASVPVRLQLAGAF